MMNFDIDKMIEELRAPEQEKPPITFEGYWFFKGTPIFGLSDEEQGAYNDILSDRNRMVTLLSNGVGSTLGLLYFIDQSFTKPGSINFVITPNFQNASDAYQFTKRLLQQNNPDDDTMFFDAIQTIELENGSGIYFKTIDESACQVRGYSIDSVMFTGIELAPLFEVYHDFVHALIPNISSKMIISYDGELPNAKHLSEGNVVHKFSTTDEL